MARLGYSYLDPTTAVTKATTAAAASAAFDTTLARNVIVAPRNGCVWWSVSGCVHGATSCPQILITIMEGAAIVARAMPRPTNMGASATNRFAWQAQGVITGLTPGSSHTYDAGFGVEFGVASSAIKYGGPDDATSNNAFGALSVEYWETDNLLALAAGGVAAKLYDPASVGSASTATLAAMAVMDSTNLRLTNVVAPSSTQCLAVIRVVGEGSTTTQNLMIGLMEGATIVGRVAPIGGKFDQGSLLATGMVMWEARFPFTLSAGNHTLDLAYGCETAVASSVLAWGGPDDTTASNAWGGALVELWRAA